MSDIHRKLQRKRLPASDGDKAARGKLAFRNRKLDFSDAPSERKAVLGSRKRENETSSDAYRSPSVNARAQLPERYALLESFYEGVETAVSLLGIRQQLCTFQAVCTTVEATTKRRFLQKHLTQIKYILPEAIHLEYVNVYDPDLRSKRWELKVALLSLPAEVEAPSGELGSSSKRPKTETVQRRRAFHARLVKFAATHADEDDDVPQHPMPERIFSRSSASGMPVATTCIPLDIVTTKHRVAVLESDSPSASSHFSKSFKTAFSLKAGKPSPGVSKTSESSPFSSGLADTILPMPINRTPHRDIHTMAERPLGTPHLAPSFSPFFSVQRSVSEPELASESLDNVHVASTVQLTPLKRRHAGLEEEEVEEEAAVREPVELQTPIKIVRTYGTPRKTTTESRSKRPHFSPAFKAHFSVTNSPMHPPASRSLLSTPVKASVSKDVSISWEVRTPGRIIEEEECAGLKTPVKTPISADYFKSPAPTSKHHRTPCTPGNFESGESSVYVTSQLPESAGFKSPAATPVKAGSSSRSLNFASPKRTSKDFSCPCSPGTDVPSTPGMQTPVNPSRASRFRNKGATKQLSLGPLFADSSDDDEAGDETHEAPSHSRMTERPSVLRSSSSGLRKSLTFASDMSEEDMHLIQGLPAHLVQSVMKEELKVAEEKSSDVVGIRRRQQMKAGLPHLFNQLRLIFQSSNKSVFPYQELLSKVVSSNTEITDKAEVEERLKMLLELAPEWISAKKSLSGDMLYRVDKRVDVLSLRKKLSGVQ